MPLSVIRSIVTRKYGDFRGIDLLNAETSVDYRRSPDCLNVWKSYNLEQSNIIQTRPGIEELIDLSNQNETNNKVYSMYVWNSSTVIVHIGKRLVKWVGFPSGTPTTTVLSTNMNQAESVMVYFKDALYILDGANYLKYDGTNLVDVSTIAFVPTTTISRSPSGRRRNVSSYQRITT